MSLPVIQRANPNNESQFYEKLCSSVQALETMDKLSEVDGYIRMTLNKLEGIRGELVRTDDDWQEWKFDQLSRCSKSGPWGIHPSPMRILTTRNHCHGSSHSNHHLNFLSHETECLSRDEKTGKHDHRLLWIQRTQTSRLWQGSGRGTTEKVPQREKVRFQLHWYKAQGCRVSYRERLSKM